MSKILDKETIEAIAEKCNTVLSQDTKSRFLKICSKYKLPFGCANYENANMIWKHTKELLLASPKHVLKTGKTVEQAQTGMITMGDCLVGYNGMEFNKELDNHILDFITEIYGKDYNFICEFDASKLMVTIENIYAELEITPPTFKELTTITNYDKYFTEKLGIDSADKQEFATTQRIAKYFNELFSGVKNKDTAINAVNNYLANGDICTLHNNLHA